MPEFEFSSHAKDMLLERDLLEEWVWRAINTPDHEEQQPDGNTHYTKAIEEREGRILRVVVNETVQPHRIVTVFFDRRLGKRK